MKALRPALQDRKFSPAYYLHGEDEFLKEEALRHLIDAAVDPATRDFNLDQRRGGELDGETLASLVGMPPMMAERRVVVIRDVPALKKDARAALERYLQSPAPDIMVVCTAPAGSKPDKSMTSLTVAVDCEPPNGAQIAKWIVNRVEKTLRTTITAAAAELLQDAVGNDLAQLAIELDKAAAFAQGKEIDEDAIAAIVGIRRDETPGRFLDAVAQRDATLALALLPGVLQQPKMGAVPLVMTLTTQTLALAIATARRVPQARQASEYFNILRAGSSNFTGRAWGEAASAWTRAAGKWTMADLDHALAVLLATDLALKSSRVSSDEHVVGSAILDICGGAAARRAA